MSVEAQSPIESQHNQPEIDPVIENDAGSFDEDAELSQAFDRISGDGGHPEPSQSGRQRDEQGRFVAGQETPVEGGEGVEQDDVTISTPAPESSHLPNILKGLSGDDIAAIPEGVRAAIAERDAKWQRTQSDLGRQVAAVKPLIETIEQFRDQFEGLTFPDGRAVSETDAVTYLFSAQKAMNENPLETLLQFAEEFNVRDQLAARLTGQQGQRNSPQGDSEALRNEIAGLKRQLAQISDPAYVDQRVSRQLEQHQSNQAVQDVISRFSQEKPLYNEIPEETMAFAIQQAWNRLGDDASKQDVLSTAYDMAVNMIPELRVKAAVQPAANNARRVQDQRRANSVNVTSTSTGKGRELTEDEELEIAFEKAQKKG